MMGHNKLNSVMYSEKFINEHVLERYDEKIVSNSVILNLVLYFKHDLSKEFLEKQSYFTNNKINVSKVSLTEIKQYIKNEMFITVMKHYIQRYFYEEAPHIDAENAYIINADINMMYDIDENGQYHNLYAFAYGTLVYIKTKGIRIKYNTMLMSRFPINTNTNVYLNRIGYISDMTLDSFYKYILNDVNQLRDANLKKIRRGQYLSFDIINMKIGVERYWHICKYKYEYTLSYQVVRYNYNPI
jgi:hypothetical protein